jgi:hypothetical protein
MIIYTNHAEKRMQQRAIPELAIELLQIYGCTEHSNGSNIRYFDKRTRQQATRAVKVLARDLDRLGDMYFVESDGLVITAGHRTRAIKCAYKFCAQK